MKTGTHFGLSVLLTAMLAAPNAYAYDSEDAKHDCKRKIRSDDRYSHFHDVKVDDQGHHNYKVTGQVKSDRDDEDHNFNCQIRHREVSSWNVSSFPGSSSDDDDDTAVKIGAGILAVAAIAAIAASQSDDDDEHSRKEETYDSGSGGSPFDDMRYLKKQCKRELRRHLNHDHGKVHRLKLTDVHLYDRELSGDGWVSFERGGRRDLSFNCDFDRRGRIHDGNYHYRGGMGGGTGDRIAVKDMARYCAGEASAKFGQRPQNISTQPAFKDQGMYSVFGQFPPSGADPTVFICTFSADGKLVGVDKQ